MNEEEEFLPGGFGELLRQAQQMQEQMARAQAAAAHELVEGHAGGGAVKVTVNGAMEFQSVTIDPDAVDPNDVGMLEDLVLAAIRDAMDRAAAAGFAADGGLSGLGGLGGLLGGAGGLGDLLGGAGLGTPGGAGGAGLADLMGPLEQMLSGLIGTGEVEDEEVGGFLAAGELEEPGADPAEGEPG